MSELEQQGKNKRTGRWNKGESGNPGGRPKGSVSITSLLRSALAKDDNAKAQELVEAMIRQSIEGNATITKEVLLRVDGPVKEPDAFDQWFSSLTDEQKAQLVSMRLLGMKQ